MTEKQNKIIRWVLIGGVTLNTLMCINLYRQMVSLEYKTAQLESDTGSAIQALSRYVWEIKNVTPNRTGEFE